MQDVFLLPDIALMTVLSIGTFVWAYLGRPDSSEDDSDGGLRVDAPLEPSAPPGQDMPGTDPSPSQDRPSRPSPRDRADQDTPVAA